MPAHEVSATAPVQRARIWVAIADTLRAEIAGGALPLGHRLPTEAQLAARFGVNRHTVRQALAALAAEGLVFARRGLGSFVAHRPVDYPLGGQVSFARNIALAGRLPGRRIASVVTRPADAAEAEALALPPGAPVHVAEGVSLIDGAPVAIFRSAFPAARLPDLPAALVALSSVTEALARCGVARFTRRRTRVGAVIADAAQAAQLAMPPGGPLLLSEALNVDPAGQPVERGMTWFAADRVRLTIEGLPPQS